MTVPSQLQDAPPSAKAAYRELDREGPMSRSQLERNLGLASSTTGDALSHLRERDLLQERTDPDDARAKIGRAHV